MGRIIKANWARRVPPSSSHVPTLEAEREHRKQERIDYVKSLVGSTERLPGTVCRIEQYGAFVNFNWGQGLVHVSQMSKNRIRHANEVVSPGQQVHVYVIAVDDRNRISLSLIAPATKQDIGCTLPGAYTAVLDRMNEAQADTAAVSPAVPLSDEAIEGKQPLHGFAELSAYWRLKQGQ
jgi:transcriptional accessory protein Tex/SPT6